MSNPTGNNTALLSGGGVEYSMAEAACDIDELIESLQNAKDNGIEFVVMSSGNYRGASWASIGTDWSWVESEDDED